jgi:hypothetical protein
VASPSHALVMHAVLVQVAVEPPAQLPPPLQVVP